MLVRVLRYGIDHKIADRWERPVFRVVAQVHGKPAYQVLNTEDQTVRTIHRNYLFPLRLRKTDPEETLNVMASQAELSFETLFSCDCRVCVEADI